MSYNPAFVSDESPLGHGQDGSADQSNGIKLTSFKPLQSPSEPAAASKSASAAPKTSKKTKTKTGKPPLLLSSSSSSPSSGKGNLLLSGSSSLSLIENQSSTLSSLSPSSATFSNNNAPPTQLASTNTTTTTSSSLSSSSTSSSSSSNAPNQCSPTAARPMTTATTTSMPSTTPGCAAVECRDMRYDVGRGNNHKTILHDINVTVPEGSIYGLLGPSGCGKTTMLRCVVGRIKPKSGQVRVFGYRPNESGSQIPGPAIGYMPQVSAVQAASLEVVHQSTS